jgi:hypothetical protein
MRCRSNMLVLLEIVPIHGTQKRQCLPRAEESSSRPEYWNCALVVFFTVPPGEDFQYCQVLVQTIGKSSPFW